MTYSHSAAILGPYHTSFSPAKALSLSPLRGCSLAQVRSAPKRSVASQLEYQNKIEWIGRSKAMVFMHSVSANASPSPRRTERASGRQDCQLSWQSMILEHEDRSSNWSGCVSGWPGLYAKAGCRS